MIDLEKVPLVEIVSRLKDDGGEEDEEEHCGGKGFHLKSRLSRRTRIVDSPKEQLSTQ